MTYLLTIQIHLLFIFCLIDWLTERGKLETSKATKKKQQNKTKQKNKKSSVRTEQITKELKLVNHHWNAAQNFTLTKLKKTTTATGNAQSQWFHWFNESQWSWCTSRFLDLRFWRPTRKGIILHLTFTLKPFVPIINQLKWLFARFVPRDQRGIIAKRLNYCKVVLWCLSCSSRLSFLNSLCSIYPYHDS